METNTRDIEARLAAVRRRIRRAQAWRGAGLWMTVALAGLALAIVCDLAAGPLPVWLRWTVTALWFAAMLWALKRAVAPLLRPVGLVAVARWLESRHPELEERLSTALEVSREGGGVSPWLLRELVSAAEKDAASLDPKIEVRPGAIARRWSRPALALLGLFALALAMKPGETSRLLLRAVVPFSDAGNAGASLLAVTPGDLEVMEGGRIGIAAVVARDAVPQVVMEFADGRVVAQAMTREGSEYRYVLEPASESFRYRVRAGSLESDAYRARVWPLPKLLSPSLVLEHPAYTELPPGREPLGPRVEALAGTRVTLSAGLNTAVEAAWLDLAGERVEGTVVGAADGGRVDFSWEMKPGLSGDAVVHLDHRLGGEREAVAFKVTALPDLVPEVVLRSPGENEMKVRPDELLELRYEVTEDHGLADVMIEAEAKGEESFVVPCDLPARATRSKPPKYRGTAEVSVGEMRDALGGANDFQVRVAAEDARPGTLGGPGQGESRWLRLRIDDHAESLARQRMREDHDGARKVLEEAARNAREARERMNWHRGGMENERLDDKAREHFDEAAERMAGAREKLDELAARMEDGLHAARSEEVRRASEKLALALQELGSVPLQDPGEKRGQKLDFARGNADEVAKRLDEVREAIERDRSKVEDIVRLQELATRQRELARQAREALAEKSPDGEWRNRQHAVENELRQQLRERPDAAEALLEARAEEAKALAAEARELAAAQESLAALQDGEVPADAIREALGKAQAAISEETDAALADAREARRPSADTLPEAASAAREAGEALAERRDAGAAGAAKDAAERLAGAAEIESAGASDPEEIAAARNLAGLAERQEAVADALESLAEGDTVRAAEALQEMQAQAAGDFAEELRRLPVIDAPGALNEARDASRKAGERAQVAAERGREGKANEAAAAHKESGGELGRAAESLERAAQDLDRMAGEAAGRPSDPSRAEASPEALAEAFGQASRAASSPGSAGAAAGARRAADALSAAAASARQAMRGRGASRPGMQEPGGMPGGSPGEGDPPPSPDPGVPPELAKLGVSAEDWEKIRGSLKGEAGAAGGGGVPEEYRGLVRDYFQSMAGGVEDDD